MNMPCMRSTWIVLLLLAALGAEAVPESFDRYQVILDRKPFGVPPPPPPVQRVPVAPVVVPSFARTLRLSMIIREDTGELKVGIVDLSNNTGMSLLVGDIENGIELVSADYDEEEAVLRKGTEMALIKLSGAEAATITPNQNPAGTPAKAQVTPPSRSSLAARRSRRTPSTAARPAITPKYTGEELKEHLQNYQMEVIRQGLPPLPIPLTQDQDDQLVREGILPATP